MRRRLSRVALVVVVGALGWAIGLGILDRGFDSVLFGVRIRSNDPTKPWIIAIAAFGVVWWLEGFRHAWRDLWAIPRRIRSGLGDRLIACLLAFGLVSFAAIHVAPVAGGADSFGYVSQVNLWLRWYPFVDQPWVKDVPWPSAPDTFSPLGYKPVGDGTRLAPIYSPGLPLLMAAIQAIAGYRAMFAVGPLSAGILVLATYGLGRRLGSGGVGLVAAWLTATSPTLIFQMLVPMTDVPPAAAWALACYALFGKSPWSAFGAGAAAGVATLIRPNLVPSALIMALWLAWSIWIASEDRSLHRRRLLAFLIGFLPSIGALAASYVWLFGSPIQSGYAPLSEIYTVANIGVMVPRYLRWLAETQTWLAWLGMAAVVLPLRILWPDTPRRSMVATLGALLVSVWIQFGAFQILDAWWYLRYVLSSWPAIMLGTGTLALIAVRRVPHLGGPIAMAIVALGLWTFHLAIVRGARDVWKAEYKYPAVGELVRHRTPANCVVMAVQHGGSLRFYGGRTTMRWDSLDPVWLDRSVDWLARQGVRTYLVLEDPEVADFQQHFRGQQRSGLDGRELVLYDGASRVHLYDLTEPAAGGPGTAVVHEAFTGPRFVRPVPVQPLRFR